MKVPVIKNTSNELPKYETLASAGMDLRAELSLFNPRLSYNTDSVWTLDNKCDHVCINPGGRALIPTGLQMALPVGYEAQVRPRSGLALKHGLTVLNSPGTIDADYRGDVGVVLINHGKEPFKICTGDRIAQLVITKHERVDFVEVEILTETDRGTGGFGHTGSK